MAKIFITGGSGFIGTNAVEYFVRLGHHVCNFDMRPPQNKEHLPYWKEGNINHLNDYKKTVTDFQPEYFIHLAARTDLLEEKDLQNGYRTNIGGVKNTLEIISSLPSLQRIIFTSSRMVCRIDYIPKNDSDYCPPNLYGESKVLGEQMVKQAKINAEWCIIRPTSIWGSWFDIPYITFFHTIKNGWYFNPGKHNPYKSFGYVENTIYQIDKLLFCDKEQIHQKCFYVCDYPPLNLKKWSEIIKTELAAKDIKTYPIWLLRIAALIGDILYKFGWKRVPMTSFRLNNLVTNMVYDTKDLEAICGPLPYSLHDGVKKTIKWMRTNKNRDTLHALKKEST
jgi:nucleoside-diphosphate-sugar epimerase